MDVEYLERRTISSTIVDSNSQNHVLLAACRDDQTASDAHIEGKYQGALSWALVQAINANPNANWVEVHKRVLDNIKRFPQVPQLSGDTEFTNRPIFGGIVNPL